ncbi:MAG: hypothetical protein GY711_07765, partial [bacterium]|nr:hypothetical protein [bacterium]
SGITPNDNEHVEWINSTGADLSVIIEVATLPPTPIVRCNTYDLLINFLPDPCFKDLGTTLCLGVPNSTGFPSVLCGSGSDVASDNDLTLNVGGLPNNTNGYWINNGGTPIFVVRPGGSQGNLCIAGANGRQFPVMNSGDTGSVSILLDLTDTPQPMGGNVSIMAGETWYWQYWHRDTFVTFTTSNFSSAIGITFQ